MICNLNTDGFLQYMDSASRRRYDRDKLMLVGTAVNLAERELAAGYAGYRGTAECISENTAFFCKTVRAKLMAAGFTKPSADAVIRYFKSWIRDIEC